MEENPYKSPETHSVRIESNTEEWLFVDDEVDDWTLLRSLWLPAVGFIVGILLAWYAVSR